MERLSEQTERCRECLGHVIRTGGECVCTSCGKVVRQAEEEKCSNQAPRLPSDVRLGSYIGDISFRGPKAGLDGVVTLGFLKLLSDNPGAGGTEQKCRTTIRMVADRLALPPFVRDNAVALSARILASRRANRGGRRTTMAAVAAYATLCACRAAGMDRIGSGTILKAITDMGHTVSRSALLKMGLDSDVPFRPADPAALLRVVMAGLEASGAVQKKLRKEGFEPGPYFRGLFQESRTVLAAMAGMKDGRNPRTVAAGSVYIASLRVAPRAVTQREVAEMAGVTEYTVREFCARARTELGPLNPGPS